MIGKKLLFSVTKDDFEIQTFCTGGNGGQHRNAKQNGVRIIHPPSGARAEHRDGRDQPQNLQKAFLKLLKTPAWKTWHLLQVAKHTGALERALDATEAAMDEKNLRVEVRTKAGWVGYKEGEEQ